MKVDASVKKHLCGNGSSPFPSMHARDVRNPKELKFCQFCGGLFLRAIGPSSISNPAKYCQKCEEVLAPKSLSHYATTSLYFNLQPSGSSRPEPHDPGDRDSATQAQVKDARLHSDDGLRFGGTRKKLCSAHEKVALAEKVGRLAMRLRQPETGHGAGSHRAPVRLSPDVVSNAGVKAGRAHKADRVAAKRGVYSHGATEEACARKHAYLEVKQAKMVLARMSKHGHRGSGLKVYKCTSKKTLQATHWHIAGGKSKPKNKY